MKYFSRPAREAAEAPFLAREFDKVFEPFGDVSVGRGTQLGTPGVDCLEVDGETLAIHPESASWAFLSTHEASLYREMDGKPFSWLAERWPAWAGTRPEHFVGHLYRRGLLTLDGREAVDARMFSDSPNYDEGNLVELLVTEKCNLACPYCLAGANQRMPAMDRPLAMRAIDLAFAMREAPSLAFELAGGEPLLKFPLLRELVAYIRAHPGRAGRPVFLSIQTNATLIDEERVRWLRDENIVVGISIDGGPWSQNDSRPQVNGQESFSKVMRGIALLQRFGVPFGALVVLNRSNIGSPAALADFLLANGIHGFRLNPVAYLGDARRNWERVGLSQEEIIDFVQRLMRLIVDRRDLLLENNVHSMCNFLTSKQRRTRCMRAQCGAGDSFQAIAGNGDIYPCGRATQSPGLKLGNVLDEGLTSLSDPARRHPVIGELRERRPHTLEDCPTCSYRQLCQSGCSAQAWERYGTVRHKTPECAFYKTLYPWLMRWLTFDGAAFDHLERTSYFEREGARFDHDFTAPRPYPWAPAAAGFAS
jgi:uncharacterized protein